MPPLPQRDQRLHLLQPGIFLKPLGSRKAASRAIRCEICVAKMKMPPAPA